MNMGKKLIGFRLIGNIRKETKTLRFKLGEIDELFHIIEYTLEKPICG